MTERAGRLRVWEHLARARERVTGPMLLLVIIVVIEAFARTPLRIPNPSAFLLLAVVYSALRDDGFRVSLTTVVAVAHTAVYFSAPGALFTFSSEQAYRLLVVVLAAPAMALMAFVMKQRAAQLEGERAARLVAERERDFVRLVLTHSPQGVVVTRGPEHAVELMNPAAEELLHATAASLAGQPFASLSPGFRRDVARVLDDALTSGETRNVSDTSFDLPDGERAIAELVAVPLADAGGARIGLLVMLSDLSARKLAEEELANARRELLRSERLATMGAMLSGVAHEIRTPLALIANTAHVLKARVEREERERGLTDDLKPAPKLLDDVVAGVDRANELVLDLRRFVKVERAERTRLDLPAVVHETLRLFAVTHPGSQAIDTDIADVPAVSGDPRHIQQILLNLVDNAVAASGATGRIVVRLAMRTPGQVELSVSDDGPGMPPGVRERAFEAFFTTKEEGTGLGLAIVKRLVEAHGGTIDCESGAEGTTFRILLPTGEGSVRVRVANGRETVAGR